MMVIRVLPCFLYAALPIASANQMESAVISTVASTPTISRNE